MMTGDEAHQNQHQRQSVASDVLAVAAYLAIAVVMTWPLALDLNRYVVSEHMDSVTAFYNLWWFHQALVELHCSPWHSPLIDYPHGYSMVLFPIWVPYDLLALPIVHALGIEGVPVAFNLIYVASFAACGYAAFALTRYLTRDAGAAFVAGLALAFMPYRFWNVTRWHVTCLELVAPCVYFFIRAVRGDSPRAWIWFAVFASLLAYTSPNYATDVFVALGLLLLFAAIADYRQVVSKATFKRLAKGSLAAMVACSPLVIRLAMEALSQPAPLAQDEALRVTYSANLLGFVLPGFTLRAYSRLVGELGVSDVGLARAHGIMGYEIFMGYVVLALAAVGAIARRKAAWPFLALAAVFVVLALGPTFHAGDYSSTWPAPYQWAQPLLPWLQVERAPVRHAGMAFLAVVVLFGMGLAVVRERLKGFARTAFVMVAAAAVLLEFFQAPLPATTIPIPGFVSDIKLDPEPGSVLDLPQLPIIKRFAGIHQMNHERPLAIQLTRRVDDPVYQAGALFRFLDRPRAWLDMSPVEAATARALLAADFQTRSIRYVVAYPRFMDPADVKGLKVAMHNLGHGEPFFESDLYLVYRCRSGVD